MRLKIKCCRKINIALKAVGYSILKAKYAPIKLIKMVIKVFDCAIGTRSQMMYISQLMSATTTAMYGEFT